ncbi:hypothetical protein ACFL0B_10200 [Thermodesulfobacteriota bacterium]
MRFFPCTLSTRCQNALIGCFDDSDIIYQPERIAAEREKLTLARNICPISLREIAEALWKLGYIDKIFKWMTMDGTD